MTVELRRDDIGLLISLVTQKIDRVGEAKEKYGLCDPSYFYRLVDMRNKLLVMPVAEELPVGFSDKDVGGGFFQAKRLSDAGVNKEIMSLNGCSLSKGGEWLNRR